MKRNLKIGFVFLVEDYQTWHMAPFAAAIHRCDWAEATSFYHYPQTRKTLETLYGFLNVRNPDLVALKTPFYASLLNGLGANNRVKKDILRLNKNRLASYDVLIGTENTLTYLQSFDLPMPPMIMVEHGAMGGCKVLNDSLRKKFHKIFFDSEKTALQCLERQAITNDQICITGYQKIELCDALHQAKPENFEGKPFILYNAHTRFEMCSLSVFLQPMAEIISKSPHYRLIVAPHAKFAHMKFSKRFRLLQKLKKMNLPNVTVDLHSQKLINMGYTRHAAIFIGDISSQIYEFLRFPRPCIFLNPSKIKWENDPDLAFWHCGEVITDPKELEGAIARAPELHKKYLPFQQKLMKGLFENSFPPPSEKAEKALKAFVRKHFKEKFSV